MDDQTAISWLARRVGFGLGPGQLDSAVTAGVAATVDALVDPDAHGVAAAPDPWAATDLSPYRPSDPAAGKQRQAVVRSWLDAMVATPRPLQEWMRWFWHGHFVSTLRVVREGPLMVNQLRMFGSLGLGDFRSLLRAVAVDPAMLVYLDGATNVVGGVNENFGREVLELFSLGIGNYTEDDVRAGAVALTGWTVDHSGPTSAFRPDRHDPTPQTYLGRSGVHDVDSVVDAIVGHPACAPFISGKIAHAILGPDVDQSVLDDLAQGFAASGMQLRPLVRAVIEAGLAGNSSSLVLAPVPWTIAAVRSVGIDLAALHRNPLLGLQAAGQVPMDAPNVGGWPGRSAWLTSSGTLARFGVAGLVATATPRTSPAHLAAATGDLAALATALGLPAGFSDATKASLQTLGTGEPAVVNVLTLALASPDLEIA